MTSLPITSGFRDHVGCCKDWQESQGRFQSASLHVGAQLAKLVLFAASCISRESQNQTSSDIKAQPYSIRRNGGVKNLEEGIEIYFSTTFLSTYLFIHGRFWNGIQEVNEGYQQDQ